MKIKFTALDYLIIFVILEILIYYLFSLKEVINYPYNYSGLILILIGGYLSFIYVQDAFKTNKTTIQLHEKPRKLITSGLFRTSRNPMYLGMALILLGFSVLFSSWINFLFPIIFILLINNFIIPFEEKILEKKFGKRYLKYKKEVRRWI